MSNFIYLSPHNDDICFSLCGVALHNRSGHLLNIYTQSHFVKGGRLKRLALMAWLALNGLRNRGPRNITDLRNAEDSQFAEACHLTRHDLALQEPSLTATDCKSLRNIQPDLRELSRALLPAIDNLLSPSGVKDNVIYCPMGIGGHRNHLAVLLVILTAMQELQQKSRVLFYEDLPYASNVRLREKGLKRFRRLTRCSLLRTPLPLTAEQFSAKLKLASIYKTQFKNQPQSVKFIPRLSEPCPPHEGTLPHEALWEIIAASL